MTIVQEPQRDTETMYRLQCAKEDLETARQNFSAFIRRFDEIKASGRRSPRGFNAAYDRAFQACESAERQLQFWHMTTHCRIVED